MRVLSTGFEFEGEIYKSLSAVAKKITGSHCNGFRLMITITFHASGITSLANPQPAEDTA